MFAKFTTPSALSLLVGVVKFFFISIPCSKADLSLPFPSLVKEIEPSISVYSTTGAPEKCFRFVGGGATTARDIAAMSKGYGVLPASGSVVFLVHGFKDDENSEWLHILKNALMKERTQTVVIVGWGGGANLPTINYKKALANINTTAPWLAEIVTELRKMENSLYIWGIGHSLGAHLLGLAGRSSPNGFHRITALDPSGPFLEVKNLNMRLRRTDAALVDVIHSDGCSHDSTPNCWVEPNNHYATLVPLGTIDFYPRYGQFLPVTHPIDIYRSHLRAVDLFLMSIGNKGLFRTNDTLDSSPGIAQLIATRQVTVTAEMGYYADMSFIPEPTDSRVNFYINSETMGVADRMRDISHKLTGKHHRKRSIVRPVDCSALPSGGTRLFGDLTVSTVFLMFTRFLLN